MSLPAAIKLPVNVRKPRMTSATSAPVSNAGMAVCALAVEPTDRTRPRPTKPAARPPKACDSAVRCGTAVSGTIASGTPTMKPTTMATTIHV